MSTKTKEQKEARALQKRTGWSYGESLRCIREMTPHAIELLIGLRAANDAIAKS